jgi:hypothetical protein
VAGILLLNVEGKVNLSASDLVGHLNCRYLTKIDLAVVHRELQKPSIWDPVLEVLAERGVLHERSYVERLKLNGFEVVNIEGALIDSSTVKRTPAAARGHRWYDAMRRRQKRSERPDRFLTRSRRLELTRD